MKPNIPIAGILLIVSGCASHPEKLPVHYVSPLKYQDHECEEITQEYEDLKPRVTDLYIRLTELRKTDSIQLATLPLMIFNMTKLDGNTAPEVIEYSQLKGEYEAVRLAAKEKNCGIEIKSPAELALAWEESTSHKPGVCPDISGIYVDWSVTNATVPRSLASELYSVTGKSQLWSSRTVEITQPELNTILVKQKGHEQFVLTEGEEHFSCDDGEITFDSLIEGDMVGITSYAVSRVRARLFQSADGSLVLRENSFRVVGLMLIPIPVWDKERVARWVKVDESNDPFSPIPP